MYLKPLLVILAALGLFASVNAADEVKTAAAASTPWLQSALNEITTRRTERLKSMPASPVKNAAGNPIDAFIEAKWAGKKWPESSDDAAFVRRVYLDVIGVIPTAPAAEKFVNDKSPDKRSRLIDQLLGMNEEYAAHWIPFWEEALAGQPPGGNGLAKRNIFTEWLLDSFKKNKPYDVMVAELLLSDAGKTAPKEERGENDKRNQEDAAKAKPGALPKGYVRNITHSDTMQTAANVGQVFLGTSLKCSICHNHFENKEWTLENVTAFAGLFSAKDLELIRCESKKNKFAQAKFILPLPENVSVPADYKGRLKHVASALVDPANPRFSKTIVNRLWKRYFGLGLFEPVDDYRADRTPTHPELLEWLANDFMQHGFDLKHTIRVILNSRAYQLKYDVAEADVFDSAKPTAMRYFRSPSLRRMTAEQMLDSVTLAGSQKLLPAQRLYKNYNASALTQALGRPAYISAVSTSRPEDISVVQLLELLNGREFSGLVYSAEILKTIASLSSDEARISSLYWSALSRPPTREETAICNSFIKDGAKWGDIYWSLVSTPEFQYVK